MAQIAFYLIPTTFSVQERIGELFGAVGNLHISLFEILYKNHFFNKDYHLLEELEAEGHEGKK